MYASEELLLFSSVSYDDFGTYRCVANASLANDTISSGNMILTAMLLNAVIYYPKFGHFGKV